MVLFRSDDPRLWTVIEQWLDPGLPLYVEVDHGQSAFFFSGPFVCASVGGIRALQTELRCVESITVARNAFLHQGKWDDQLTARFKQMVERECADWMMCSAAAVYPEEIAEITSGNTWQQIVDELSRPESQAILRSASQVLIGKNPDFPALAERRSADHLSFYPDVLVVV